ncbi:alcohol dehydrogenase-like protein [Dactylonectria estremocensis]|uniref:Alcohol dehydrogenase-like protein n=1 Tax=Dactylonectria estremocensis TaxID=1079267 RepID=A0A9P9EDI5_9HYPO|nr:alcohol dehydrogenase-like protein [Dactylonectria estremocensis]
MTSSIPVHQTAAWVENPGPCGRLIIRHDVDVQQPREREVLVRVEYSGVCHSDCMNLIGRGEQNPIPGHEGVGTVVSLGPNSPSALLDRRVGVKWLWSACNSCKTCRSGRINNCPFVSNTGRNKPGTLAQYVIAHADFVTFIPEGLPSEIAAPLLCAGLTMAGAVSLCAPETKPGRGLGHLRLQFAVKARGYRVVAIDTGSEKKSLCLKLGATAFLDFAKENVAEQVKMLTGGEGADAVIVVVGSEKAYELAPTLLRNTGTLVCVGIPRFDFHLPIAPIEMADKGFFVKGSSTGTKAQMDEVFALAISKEIVPHIEVYPFSKLAHILGRLLKNEVSGRIVVKVP